MGADATPRVGLLILGTAAALLGGVTDVSFGLKVRCREGRDFGLFWTAMIRGFC